MDYKDFIKAGERVVYMPNWSELSWYCDYENCIVKIGEYRPYYTNGDADPTPEEYNEWCYVEAYPESKKVDESQFCLNDLHPIEKSKEDISVIYDGRRCKLIGKVLELDYVKLNYKEFGVCLRKTWNENGYVVIENEKGEWKVVEDCECEIERNVSDLSFDDLKKLRGQIYLGSIYIHHYNNTFGVDANDLCELCDDYWRYLCDEYGEENADEHDTPEEFANFMAA